MLFENFNEAISSANHLMINELMTPRWYFLTAATKCVKHSASNTPINSYFWSPGLWPSNQKEAPNYDLQDTKHHVHKAYSVNKWGLLSAVRVLVGEAGLCTSAWIKLWTIREQPCGQRKQYATLNHKMHQWSSWLTEEDWMYSVCPSRRVLHVPPPSLTGRQ